MSSAFEENCAYVPRSDPAQISPKEGMQSSGELATARSLVVGPLPFGDLRR